MVLESPRLRELRDSATAPIDAQGCHVAAELGFSLEVDQLSTSLLEFGKFVDGHRDHGDVIDDVTLLFNPLVPSHLSDVIAGGLEFLLTRLSVLYMFLTRLLSVYYMRSYKHYM